LGAILDPPVGCVELRVLEANSQPDGTITSHDQYKSTHAAWFEDPDEVLGAIHSIRGVSAYITINPVNRALLARSNRLTKQKATSNDVDVVVLRNILLDFDAKRPTDISSTDAELAAALARRDRVLGEHPEIDAASIWGCSGNGGFILVRLPDYPNDEPHRNAVKEFVDLLSAKYTDQAVEIDRSTCNPSRIMGLVGTVKCKGLDTPDRPHRPITLDSDPAKPRQPLDLVAWLDRHRPPPAPAAAPPSGGNGQATGPDWTTPGGDVEKRAIAYLAKCDPAVSGQKGHNRCFSTACKVGPGFDLPEDVALRLLRDRYNPRCTPPWSEKELLHKVKDAYKKVKRRGWLLQGRNRRAVHGRSAKHKPPPPNNAAPAAAAPRLANFKARITREVIRHEAGETHRHFEITATHEDGTVATTTIAADKFESMAWVPRELGSKFSITPGRSTRDQMRHAIQVDSHRVPVPYVEIYTALGWHTIGGEPVYLHVGGGIGAAGPVAAHVDAQKELTVYSLPAPDEGRFAQGVEKVLVLHDTLGNPAAAVVVCLPYRAVLGPARYVPHFSGSTGTCKTSVACLCTRFFAPGLERDAPMPGRWQATVHGLERLQYEAANVVLPIDNLVADGSEAARELYKADTVFNRQGDLAGRQRMRPDGTLAPTLDPRATVISTGEIDPRRRSALGRSLVVEFEPKKIADSTLDSCHDAARAGHYAATTARYIQHLAAPGRLDAQRGELRRLTVDEQAAARKQAPDCHPRQAEAVAELIAAWRLFLDFAVDRGVLARDRADRYVATVRDELFGLLAAQAGIQHESDPGELFVELVKSLLGSKRAVLSLMDGTRPADDIAGSCGWDRVLISTQNHAYTDWQPASGAARIGWVDDTHVYLDPVVAHAAAERLARETHQVLGTQRQILSRLAETGRLVLDPQTQGTRRRFTRRAVIEKSRRWVIQTLRDEVLDLDPPATATGPQQPTQGVSGAPF
jgi:hypothetical protein